MPAHNFQAITTVIKTTLLQKPPQHPLFLLIIPLVPYRQVHPCLFIDNASIMTEGLKSGAAMVAAHAALTHTSEGHGTGSQVDDGVVDASAAKMAMI